MHSPAARLLLLGSLCLLLAWVVFAQSAALYGASRESDNRLKLRGQWVSLHPPIELDGLSREAIHALRRERVAEYPDLVDGPYAPRQAVFGRIEDGRPWWGLEGQFCHGPGPRSSDGLSEESRFIANPFLVLAVGEAVAIRGLDPCVVAVPEPTALTFSEDWVVVEYDITDFQRRVESAGREPGSALFLHNLNARDWGYDWLGLLSSSGVRAAPGSALGSEAVRMRGYLHRGGSCGQKGGCNNGSPNEPDMYVRVDALPAELELGLFRERPEPGQAPELRVLIRMR